MLDAFGEIANTKATIQGVHAMKVLFVCLGNICRSPAAEGVFRVMAPEVETDSAGTGR